MRPWSRARPALLGNEVTLLRDGAEAFPAMLAAIGGAREQVLLAMYWFASDGVGRRFAEALGAAAERGVDVCVVYDAVGSLGADADQFDRLRLRGAHVHAFNPLSRWPRGLVRLTRRDHRKLLVVDGETAFTGGVNLGDEWDSPEQGGGGWRDDMVRVVGPASAALARNFREHWPSSLPTPRRLPPPPPRAAGYPVRALGEAFFRHQSDIFRAYVARIVAARSRVWIRNSYFVPDGRVLRALVRAARRGVDVRLLLPGVSDVTLVQLASRSVYQRLFDAGIRIFEWPDLVLHAKSAVVDDDWATVGTFNLDHLSWRVHLEVNVAIEDPRFAREMVHSFERDFDAAGEVDARAHLYRPLLERWLQRVAYSLRRFL